MYLNDGATIVLCGSFANIGYPLIVLFPEIVQLLLPMLNLSSRYFSFSINEISGSFSFKYFLTKYSFLNSIGFLNALYNFKILLSRSFSVIFSSSFKSGSFG